MAKQFNEGYALIVGVGADLPNTVDDAVGLADILKDSGRCAFPADQVHLLTGEHASRDDVLNILDTLSKSTDDASTVVIYFSGHGHQVTSTTGEAYYLMPYGYDTEKLFKTAISGREFTDKLRAIPAQKLLVLLDCCHAGGVGEARVPGVELTKSPLPPEALALLSAGKGRVLIASSQEDELSYAGKPYSAFTLALIEALCGQGVAKKDGFVRVSDLAMYTREKVPGRTDNRQHPILHFEHADNFAIAYYAGGDAEPKGLPFAEEPQIEPEPGAWTGINMEGQVVHGTQTIIEGNVKENVLSGSFNGPVSVGGGDSVDMRGSKNAVVFNQKGQKVGTQTNIGKMSGGFVNTGMTVHGNVQQAGRDIRMGDQYEAGRDIHQASQTLSRQFEKVLERVAQLSEEDRRVVKPVVESVRDQVTEIQQSGIEDDTSPQYGKLKRGLKTLVEWVPDIADVVLAFLQNPVTGIVKGVRQVAERIKSEMK
jgi:hypothetical protein